MVQDPIATIVTDRLTLTPLAVADAGGMLAVYSDHRMYEFTGGSAPTEAQLRSRYEKLVNGWNHDRSEQWCNWIVRVDGGADPVGVMQATIAHDRSHAAVAWEIGVPDQGRGYATEAAGAMIGWLLATGVSTITASIHPDHLASARVAARSGLVATEERDDGEIVWRYGATDAVHPELL